MVDGRKRLGKASVVRFAEPPWDETHPRWLVLDQELPEDHLAREVRTAIEQIDLTPLYESYSGRGSLPIRPDLMLRIVLIEIRLGRIHPSDWFRDTKENEPLKWAGMGIQPSRTVWYEFHDRVAKFLETWNRQTVEVAVELGVTSGTQASLDGSAFAANASRHRLVNEGVLAKRMELLRGAITDDDAGNSLGGVPSWLATTPSTRQIQLERYERSQGRLVELHVINERQSPGRRRSRSKIVVSTSDPEAALGRDKFHVFRPLYNTQFVSDLNSPLILSYGVFAQPTDAGTLQPMTRKVCSMKGIQLENLLVDAGYVTASNLALCHASQINLYGPWQENDYSQKKKSKKAPKKIGKDQFVWSEETQVYICPQGNTLKWIGKQNRRQTDGEINVVHSYRCSPDDCRGCPVAADCTTNPNRGRSVKRSEHEKLVAAHREKMATDEAKQLYKKRKKTVELSFADIKEHRGLRRFPRRGLTRATTQVGLAVLVHNLLVVHRATETQGKHEN